MLFTTGEFVSAFYAKWVAGGNAYILPITTAYCGCIDYPVSIVTRERRMSLMDGLVQTLVYKLRQDGVDPTTATFMVTDIKIGGDKRRTVLDLLPHGQ